jgi:hypothetical protein
MRSEVFTVVLLRIKILLYMSLSLGEWCLTIGRIVVSSSSEDKLLQDDAMIL